MRAFLYWAIQHKWLLIAFLAGYLLLQAPLPQGPFTTWTRIPDNGPGDHGTVHHGTDPAARHRKDRYKLLICTDSTPASGKAEVFGTRLAQMLQSDVMLLSVARSRNSEHAAMEEAERISKSMAKAGIRHSIAIRVGSMPDAIAELAREDTMVVMGAAQISEIKKFFFGSIPAKVIDRINCPVLIIQ